MDPDAREPIRKATRVGIAAVGVALAFVALLIALGALRESKCRIERVNCRPAVRFGWDRGPVAYPDMRCEERCR